MTYPWDKLIPLILKTVAWFLGLITIILLFSAFVNLFLPPEIPLLLMLVFISLWLMQLASSGVIQEWINIYPEITKTSKLNDKFSPLVEPIKIARIHYKIDDPEGQDSFDVFLDEPLYSTKQNPNNLISPSQLAENITMQYAQKIEGMYGGLVTVNAEVHRGSLAVTLEFLLNAYTVVAQINDVYESISLVRRLIRKQLSNIAGAYKEQTNRNARIDSDISVQGQSRISQTQEKSSSSNSDSKEQKDGIFPQPVTVTNTFTPPSSNREMKIDIAMPASPHFRGLGCFSFMLSVGVILAIIIGIYSYCGFFSTNSVCLDIRDTILRNVASLLIKTAMYLDEITMH